MANSGYVSVMSLTVGVAAVTGELGQLSRLLAS